MHQICVVNLCLAGDFIHKKQVIKHANIVLQRQSNLIGVAKECRLDHQHCESGAIQFEDGPMFMLKLASRSKPPPSLGFIMMLIKKKYFGSVS